MVDPATGSKIQTFAILTIKCGVAVDGAALARSITLTKRSNSHFQEHSLVHNTKATPFTSTKSSENRPQTRKIGLRTRDGVGHGVIIVA